MDTKYRYYQLENGFKIALAPLTNVNTIYIGIMVKIGAMAENLDELGIAHFLEHMLFTNTKKYTEDTINHIIDMYGANINAYTTHNNTVYYINGLSKYMEDFLDIILDIFFNPVFLDESVERERNVIIEELKQSHEMNLGIKSYLHALQVLFNERLKYSIIGNKETISNITKESLQKFRSKNYKVDDSYLIISGNIDFNILEKKLGKLYPWEPQFNKPEKNLLINYNNLSKPYLKIIESDINQTIVNIFFKSPYINSQWLYPLSILKIILTNSNGSILNNSLRRKLSATYYVNSYNFKTITDGYFNISFNCNNDKLIIALKELFTILKNLEIDNEMLEKSKNTVETGYVFSKEQIHHHFDDLLNSLCYNIKIPSLEDIMRYISNSNVKVIKKLCKKMFIPSNTYIILEGKNIKINLEDFYNF